MNVIIKISVLYLLLTFSSVQSIDWRSDTNGKLSLGDNDGFNLTNEEQNESVEALEAEGIKDKLNIDDRKNFDTEAFFGQLAEIEAEMGKPDLGKRREIRQTRWQMRQARREQRLQQRQELKAKIQELRDLRRKHILDRRRPWIQNQQKETEDTEESESEEYE